MIYSYHSNENLPSNNFQALNPIQEGREQNGPVFFPLTTVVKLPGHTY